MTILTRLQTESLFTNFSRRRVSFRCEATIHKLELRLIYSNSLSFPLPQYEFQPRFVHISHISSNFLANVILLGSTGDGKSYFGNYLVNYCREAVFPTGNKPTPCTDKLIVKSLTCQHPLSKKNISLN